MKKIEFIAPVEAMRGNLSGSQKIAYAENMNPAYEAPNGAQSALNYQPRFIGAKRSKDGLKYFTVRTKQTAVLNNKTRMAMGLTGVTQACWAAITPATREQVAAIVASVRALDPTNPEYASTAKCWNARCRRMLLYKEAQFVIAGPAGSFVFKNPYDLGNAEANQIKSSTWLKFAELFAFHSGISNSSVFYFFIDGVRFLALNKTGGTQWGEMNQEDILNPNWKATLTGIVATDQPDSVTYLGQQIYTDTAAVSYDDDIEPIKYTTIAPGA